MKSYSRFIQVRTSSQDNKGRKKIYVKGYASTKGLYDTYKWMKNPDGTYKKFRSLFTDECIADMKRQAMSKTIFVDALHTIATDEGILELLKEKGASSDEIAEVKTMLKQKKLPLAKPVEFEVDDDGFMIGTETNPYFADVDKDHEAYYNATTNSILDGYLKAYSINFDPVDSVTETDEDGNEWTRFNKVNLYGISYTDQPALETNSFTEVAMRSMMEIRTGETMKQGNEGNEQQDGQVKPATDPVKTEPDKKEVGEQQPTADDAKPIPQQPVIASTPHSDPAIEAEIQKRVAEIEKQKEIASQQETQVKDIEKLKSEMAELRKSQPQPKSVVKPNQDKFGDAANPPGDPNLLNNQEALQGKLKEITAKHNLYMEDFRKGVHPSLCRGEFMGGFGEMIQLQADTRAHTARKPGEDEINYQQRIKLQQINDKDDMVVVSKQNRGIVT